MVDFEPGRMTRPASGVHLASGAPVTGYEIHLGRTPGPDAARPVLALDGRPDGAASPDGRVQGVYLHGLFGSDAFRQTFLEQFGAASRLAYETRIEAALDALADCLEAHLDLDRVLAIARGR